MNLKTIEANQSLLVSTWIDLLLDFFVHGDSKFAESQMSDFLNQIFRKNAKFSYVEFLKELQVEFSLFEYEDQLLYPLSSITVPLWEDKTLFDHSKELPPDLHCTFYLTPNDMVKDSHFTFKNSGNVNHIEKVILLDGIEWTRLTNDRFWSETGEGMSYRIQDKV
ncbi:hypothetical protein ND861_09425 [Leptospira sp. 2 VSF19]|uniref:Uncharacterized protein n=1 Tax=Leptospira soteropolitanensis TaxID=2950025 RepID=A0AAW5VFK3_9LEPT|nr:hypothetical protein [Leptospira soteropolitanensis]MCW7500623.1 hypothetical protein [Leptospira soteropolitanensis]MCW7522707.1 hypothetical protein [Leptospira soteropolitanensis]MCW7526563.1 hypothetical protein [Leptospira soteropolitanensis]MCW7530593.1 hypothetical protein [Leptospira soteropolitanensis]